MIFDLNEEPPSAERETGSSSHGNIINASAAN